MGDEVDLKTTYLKENLKFLDAQTLIEPSVNEQIGYDFQGLRRSFRDDPDHPDASSVARFGRIWIYDVALSIYADLKAGRIRQAGYQAGRVMKLALREQARGFQGLWHFSYNTQGDVFIDPRGPTGANAWCLNALYAYALAREEGSVLEWANRAVQEFLFAQQVMDPKDPRFGLIRAGFHNADDLARGEAMGYRAYEGRINHPYEHVILEHCADAACTFRLAYRAARRFQQTDPKFLEQLIHRHDLLLQGMRRSFWQGDHFVSALDEKGKLFTGTDGLPSIAVDNNTWAAQLFIPYDLELARAAARYVENRFLTQAPPAHLENCPTDSPQPSLEGLYYFTAAFVDPFVQIPQAHRAKLEKLIHPEATFGFILFLLGLAESTPDAQEKKRFATRAQELYDQSIALQRLYGPSGAPYASANIPQIFSTLHSMTTAASGVITTAILQGASSDDFIGVVPAQEFTVAGQPPRESFND